MKTSGNSILVTGGATGIGLALASQFLEAGNEVIICGRRENKLKEAKEKFPGLHTFACDVSREEERQKLISWTSENFKSFNILINNAGIQRLTLLKQENTSAWISEEININLLAPINLSNLVVKHFSERESAIINITSGLAFIPLTIVPVYCATKAALHSFSVSMRHQLKDTSIRVFEVIPPTVESELGRDSARKNRHVEGISPSVVAEETLKAMQSDNYFCLVGSAQGLYEASRTDKEQFVLQRMNG